MQKTKTAIDKLGAFLSDNFYNVLLWIILGLNILPILAPVLAAIGLTVPAQLIYSMYSFFCHQLDWRSYHICDHQYGWCSRCTSIWLTVLLTGILVKNYKVKPIKWYWVVALILPMALDGIIQTVATLVGFASSDEIYYMSNDLVRTITGSLFGAGFGIWVWTTIADTVPESKLKKDRKDMSLLKTVLLALGLFAVLFVVIMVIWQLTSPNKPPVNFLDFAVKTPVYPRDFLIRARDAIY